MKAKTLIVGKGFIGERLQEAFNCDISAAKIFSFKDAEKIVKRHKPRVLINCIGSTGKSNVDDCERDKDKTLMANTFVPIILAEAALRHGVKLVHISSGCIFHYDFQKDKPLNEARLPDFFDLYYSRSKIYSERALEMLSGKFGVLIVRVRIPLDNRPHAKNILTKLISYKKVIDIPNSLTYIPDFIKALKHLIRIDSRGIYNVVNKGGLRYPAILDIYKKYVPDFKYEVIQRGKLGLVRTNILLSTLKLQKTGFRVRDINDVLKECVQEYVKR